MNRDFKLPESLGKLSELATNLWFSWNPDVRDLFKHIDAEVWQKSGGNPVLFLDTVTAEKIKKCADDPVFIEMMEAAWQRLQTYLNEKQTAFATNFPRMMDHQVAYFSAEYGLHESLPNYAGGLGVLAGDHTKSASDIGLPFVAVGLMYKHAYFQQEIDVDGNQVEIYNKLDLDCLPISLVRDENGDPLIISVPLLDHQVFIQIWQVKAGRVNIFLLDTSVDLNNSEDKNIIHSLYGGSRDTRMQQEIILGIGGLRALRKMGFAPSVFHMNEGHSAFLGLERIYELMNQGMEYKTALEFVRATNVFTTHTPIPAGNEAFEYDMMEKYFKNFWPEIEISHETFFDLGRNVNIHQHANFSLTVLALNLSSLANGVSQLHGEVSRKMWQKVFPAVPTDEIPIGHVTNGIHPFSWLHREMITLFDTHLGVGWRKQIRNQNFWDKIYDIPNDQFWNAMMKMKKELIDHIRKTYDLRLERYGERKNEFPAAASLLDPDALTIGFARRFAPYKRSLLLFRDFDRLKKILDNTDVPVQFIFSGKAHPANDAGKDLIRKINEYAKDPQFKGRVVFVEDYSMRNARALVSGVDVWLNTPRRPLEASGTSGEKVPINGGINFSILDGWWLEGYDGQNGWAIGESRNYEDSEQQDKDDAESLYNILENVIIPLYYRRNAQNVPDDWIETAKHSLQSTISRFSAHRMVWDYVQKYYIPAMKRSEMYSQEEFKALHQFSRWKNRLTRSWNKMRLTVKNGSGMDEDRRILAAGEDREIALLIDPAGLNPDDLDVEIILDRHDAFRGHQSMKIIPMGLVRKHKDNQLEYRAHVVAESDGSYRFNCRVLPAHDDLYHRHEVRLIHWLD
ncbi:MAG: alpha-glucan family phosphorylase [Calditrichales bacterium]|nr:MAG: alpha-glucan family phosphorylase [Calditrichales bacterium]